MKQKKEPIVKDENGLCYLMEKSQENLSLA